MANPPLADICLTTVADYGYFLGDNFLAENLYLYTLSLRKQSPDDGRTTTSLETVSMQTISTGRLSPDRQYLNDSHRLLHRRQSPSIQSLLAGCLLADSPPTTVAGDFLKDNFLAENLYWQTVSSQIVGYNDSRQTTFMETVS